MIIKISYKETSLLIEVIIRKKGEAIEWVDEIPKNMGYMEFNP